MKKNVSKGCSPVSGTPPPKKNQFGEVEGNPRHNGAWKKEDTLRYKLQQVAKMTAEELQDLLRDPEAGEYDYVNPASTRRTLRGRLLRCPVWMRKSAGES